MKVGLVLDDTLDTPDGVQQYVLTLGGWLIAHGHEVRYLVGQTTRTDIPHVHSLSRNLKVRFNGNRMSMPLPSASKHIRQLLVNEQFDVLHIQVPYSPFMGGQVVRLAPARTAVVGTFHILPYGRLERYANCGLAILNAGSARRFTAMIAASEPAAAFARSCYGFQAQVIPHPFDYHQFALAASTAPPTNIVYLGRLVERKGALWLLKAVAYMKTQTTLAADVRLVIGGKGPLLPELQSYVQQHGLQSIVSFCGFIPENDKAAFLSQADIAVFPSVAGESFGISVIEAMAAARGVVLAGDNPGYRSALAIPGQLVDPTDTRAFAQALTDWSAQPARRLEAAVQQRSIAATYDRDIICASVLTVYEQALQTTRGT